MQACAPSGVALPYLCGNLAANLEFSDDLETPKIVEVPVGMEINMYACAARK